MDIPKAEQGAMALNEAMNRYYFKNLPAQPEAWRAYKAYQPLRCWAQCAIAGLLVLTVFETPLWCNQSGYWSYESPRKRCAVKAGADDSEIIMSGMPMVPIGMGVMIEYILLGVIVAKLIVAVRLQRFFGACGMSYFNRKWLALDICMACLGLTDVVFFTFHQTSNFRVAPYVRFGLAVAFPVVRSLLYTLLWVLVEISKVMCFLVGTIMIFAWVMAQIMDDLTMDDRYGVPVNQGFESFGNSVYTSFVTMTTANLPDVMVPSYAHNRSFILVWMPFFLLAVCIFSQVILATVYSKYQDQKTQQAVGGYKNRHHGICKAFAVMEDQTALTGGQLQRVMRYSSFEQLVDSMRALTRSINVHKSFMKILFKALDDDGNGFLTLAEFHDLCDVLQHRFRITKRDSRIRRWCGDGALGRALASLMDNGAEGPDYGYSARFEGSLFDQFVNAVLAFNFVWMLLESYYDFSNMEEPSLFSHFDLFFSFIYLVEVGLKLCYWSWEEYWTSTDNRFDFFTTVVLAVGGSAYLCFDLSKDVLRYLNLLRLVRLLKALNNIPYYRRICQVIARMLTTCRDVATMNFLVIYLWSAAGVQLFGGKLRQGSPALKGQDLDYFGSNFQVYNFNDMISGMVTMFFFTITGWFDPLVAVCLALSENYTAFSIGTYAFMLSFYLISVLLAFNVFTAFSIDVFCKIQEYEEASSTQNEVERNLSKIRASMAEQGLILHIEMSPELIRSRVYADMFLESFLAQEGHEEALSG